MNLGLGYARSAGIDLLRGLSVLLVVLHHIHVRFRLSGFETTSMLPRWLERVLFWSGYYSVITFFVISGYLITHHSLARWGALSRISLRDFYLLRFARLAPCLLALLAVLSGLHLARVDGFQIDPACASLPRALLAALGLHVNWLEGHRGYLPGAWDVLWSLSVEEAFYVVFPLLCITLRRELHLGITLLSLLVLGPWSRTHLAGRSPWDDYAYFSCLDGIAFGCLAALAVRRLDLPRWSGRLALTVGSSAVLLVVVFRTQTGALGLTGLGLNVSVLELGVALMLVAFGSGTGNDIAARGSGLVRRLGRASYEIYLTHMFVVLGLTAVFQRFAPHETPTALWYLVLLVPSLVLGLLVARYFSEPATRALRSACL